MVDGTRTPKRGAARSIACCVSHQLWIFGRLTGEPICRFERARSGELADVDIKKLGSITGGGW
ncbi:hypothetical protein ACIGBH_14075 [Streptomyces sp. NPDC085929]|uniref:hypothetical protein n=1 Tax=Streptomyces sp. NPDC085929 TaxID=3365739 RepID=UPI0037D80FA3